MHRDPHLFGHVPTMTVSLMDDIPCFSELQCPIRTGREIGEVGGGNPEEEEELRYAQTRSMWGVAG